jgi:hypothetical protein
VLLGLKTDIMIKYSNIYHNALNKTFKKKQQRKKTTSWITTRRSQCQKHLVQLRFPL